MSDLKALAVKNWKILAVVAVVVVLVIGASLGA